MRCRSKKELEAKIASLEGPLARAYTYRLLARRPYLTAELGKKLRAHCVSEPVISQMLADCQRLGYLNDDEYLEAFVRSKEAKGWGWRKIQQAIFQKGGRKMEGRFSSDRENAQIKRWIAKKWPHLDRKDRAMIRKIFSSLIRRGFSEEGVRAVLMSDDR